jgi:hypothetical protein
MSFNGAGVWSANSVGLPVVTSTVISSTMFNAFQTDLTTGLSTCMLKDGTQTPTADLPMHNFKITGLGAPSVAGDALRYGDVQTIANGGTGRSTIVPNGAVLQSNGTSYVAGMNPIAAALVFGL